MAQIYSKIVIYMTLIIMRMKLCLQHSMSAVSTSYKVESKSLTIRKSDC